MTLQTDELVRFFKNHFQTRKDDTLEALLGKMATLSCVATDRDGQISTSLSGDKEPLLNPLPGTKENYVIKQYSIEIKKEESQI